MPRKTWRPRASSFGYYQLCDYRALIDRMIATGELEIEQERGDTPYTCLGTVIHYVMQSGMQCKFPGHAIDHAYTPAELTMASELFGNDEDRCLEMAVQVALRAAKRMPKLDKGVEWWAEREAKAAYMTGHIDFLSSDHKYLIDLKTTSRPPEGNRAKREHIGQLFAYRLLCEDKFGFVPRYGQILYAGSQRADWDLMTPAVDFHSEEAMEHAEGLRRYIKYLRSAQLKKIAIPRISAKCKDYFCPYYKDCHEAIIPKARKRRQDNDTFDLPTVGTPPASLKDLA